MAAQDQRRVERLLEALERTLARLEQVDPAWPRYGPVYPQGTSRELVLLHEARSEARTGRLALDRRRCRACKLARGDVPKPENFHFVERDLCVDCAMEEAGARVEPPDPDDPRGFATDHKGRP